MVDVVTRAGQFHYLESVPSCEEGPQSPPGGWPNLTISAIDRLAVVVRP